MVQTLPGVTARTLTTPRITTRVLFSGDEKGDPIVFVHGNGIRLKTNVIHIFTHATLIPYHPASTSPHRHHYILYHNLLKKQTRFFCNLLGRSDGQTPQEFSRYLPLLSFYCFISN